MLLRALAFTVLGLLLLLRPGDTVRTLTRLVGIVLLTLGSIDLVVGSLPVSTGAVRRLVLLRGAVTVVLGIALTTLTDASLTVVAILAGMQLVIGGGVSLLLGSWSRGDVAGWKGVVARGAITVLAGGLVIAWPQKTVEIVAIVLGIEWLISGAVSTAVAVTVAGSQ